MFRRSSRLVSGGYYNSDDESDSSTVTNISYRENPVKVFKKKAGTRKAANTPSKAHSVGADPPAAAAAADQHDGLSPSPLRPQTTMRAVSYVSTTVTPRPPLTTSSTRGQRSPAVPPEKSLNAGPSGSGRPGLHRRPVDHKELLSPGGVDSSGYSSSEGPRRKPAAAASSSGAPSASYWDRISCSFYTLTDSVSVMVAALLSQPMRLTAFAAASVGGRTKKACGLFLLLLITLLCIWLLLPFFTSLVTKTLSRTKPLPHPHLQPDTKHPASVVDPAVVSAGVEARIQHLLGSSVVSAAVEAKMTHLLEEQQLKQEHLLSQVSERLQLEVQDVKAQLEAAAVDSDDRLRLEREVSGLVERMLSYQADSRSSNAGLRLRIQALEAQNTKLSLEWSSIQLRPPSAPCPDTSSPPVQTQLTPELQQAMQKWLSDRLKQEQLHSGSCSDCGRPVADTMADFALESQGASVISTRCSETYRIRSACVTLFGIPLWYPSESPRTVIQGYPVLLPGKCWAFHGVQGSLVISLSHPITLTHVTLDHLPRCKAPAGRIDSAPKDFEIYGMKDDVEEGTLLGTFTYDEEGESTQTFMLPNPSDVVHRCVELRVLSNWGHVEYTCLYRFRVHGQMAATR